MSYVQSARQASLPNRTSPAAIDKAPRPTSPEKKSRAPYQSDTTPPGLASATGSLPVRDRSVVPLPTSRSAAAAWQAVEAAKTESGDTAITVRAEDTKAVALPMLPSYHVTTSCLGARSSTGAVFALFLAVTGGSTAAAVEAAKAMLGDRPADDPSVATFGATVGMGFGLPATYVAERGLRRYGARLQQLYVQWQDRRQGPRLLQQEIERAATLTPEQQVDRIMEQATTNRLTLQGLQATLDALREVNHRNPQQVRTQDLAEKIFLLSRGIRKDHDVLHRLHALGTALIDMAGIGGLGASECAAALVKIAKCSTNPDHMRGYEEQQADVLVRLFGKLQRKAGMNDEAITRAMAPLLQVPALQNSATVRAILMKPASAGTTQQLPDADTARSRLRIVAESFPAEWGGKSLHAPVLQFNRELAIKQHDGWNVAARRDYLNACFDFAARVPSPDTGLLDWSLNGAAHEGVFPQTDPEHRVSLLTQFAETRGDRLTIKELTQLRRALPEMNDAMSLDEQADRVIALAAHASQAVRQAAGGMAQALRERSAAAARRDGEAAASERTVHADPARAPLDQCAIQ